jgi:uncharacterized protein (DUF2236 family)
VDLARLWSAEGCRQWAARRKRRHLALLSEVPYPFDMAHPLAALLAPPPGLEMDFAHPAGAPALVPANSVSWRVFANPLGLFIGGVAAVILELAEPSVRAGVWDHSSFRTDPLTRMRRTGAAAMIAVYAPRDEAAAMIARVVALHEKVQGELPDRRRYRANDPRLLDWVQATATYGFVEAYHRYAAPLREDERSAAFAEGSAAAQLFGATGAPRSLAEWEALLAQTLPQLEPSATLGEFLQIMRDTPILPAPLRPMQRLLVRAAVEIVPPPVRQKLDLGSGGLRSGERLAVSALARIAERVPLPSSPPAQARKRMRAAGPSLSRSREG